MLAKNNGFIRFLADVLDISRLEKHRNGRIDMCKKNVGVTARSRYLSATCAYRNRHEIRHLAPRQANMDNTALRKPYFFTGTALVFLRAERIAVTASCVSCVPDNRYRTDAVSYTAGPRNALSGTTPTSDRNNACADGTHLHQNSANIMKQQATHYDNTFKRDMFEVCC